jgi:hypothetical protein
MEKFVNNRKHHIIYKTTCLVTGKYYIGMHSTNDIDDGYLGSGHVLKLSINKYGELLHTREILEFVDTREHLRQREAVLIEKVLRVDPLCMNAHPGGSYGWEHRVGLSPWNKGKTCVNEETRRKMSLSKKGKPSPRLGAKLTDETKRKLREAHIGRPWTSKRREAQNKRGRNGM